MSIHFDVVDQDGTAIAELGADVLPRPGEQIKLRLVTREDRRERESEAGCFEVLRVSFVARANTYRTPPFGYASP